MSGPRDEVREDGQRLGEVNIDDTQAFGDGELNPREVPDAANAGLHELVGAALGGGVRHGEDPQLDLEAVDGRKCYNNYCMVGEGSRPATEWQQTTTD